MQDTQSLADDRGVEIDQVGLCDFRYPIVVLDRERAKQHTTGQVRISVNLPHHFKGTHMSRFVEVVNENRGEVTMHTLPGILRRLQTRLEAESAHLEVGFTYFLEKPAPATGVRAMMDYECKFIGELDGDRDEFRMMVAVPVTSLCPCSKAISDYGAHNQRGIVEIEVLPARGPDGQPDLIWIEELIDVAEKSGSAPVYPLLKREDERFVTMQAYDNPVFVEDILRNVAVQLKNDRRVDAFSVHVVNFESIHNHSVFAKTSWQRPPESDTN